MSRIEQCFTRLADEGRKGLITFITAGDPGVAVTPALMRALVTGGADIIELGVPFSDPMADGEVIQRASERALAAGTSLDDIFDVVAEFRRQDNATPVVLMGYLNPIERMGESVFIDKAARAGVDGALVVDMPPEEAASFNPALRAAGLDQIFLVAPNSPDARIDGVRSFASGFVYFVSVKGVTGGKAVAVDAISERIARARERVALPVGIGFGIRTPAAAADAARISDAVIVGSAIVELIESGGDTDAMTSRVQRFVSSLRAAIDAHADAA